MLPELEPAFKAAGQLVVEVGLAVAHHVDKYVLKKLGDRYQARLEDVIRTTRTTKVSRRGWRVADPCRRASCTTSRSSPMGPVRSTRGVAGTTTIRR